ncbi:hypothetical protein K1719_035236 [Acacia pycnantha]|nr:hypothetical protein K1719_035236 [Acacia pycnantha]
MMEEKLLGCGIKATPHIMSRLKTLKRLWQAVYDIVYGPNTSGFGWDPETKLVIADKEVWDEYLKKVRIDNLEPESVKFMTRDSYFAKIGSSQCCKFGRFSYIKNVL